MIRLRDRDNEMGTESRDLLWSFIREEVEYVEQ